MIGFAFFWDAKNEDLNYSTVKAENFHHPVYSKAVLFSGIIT